MKDNKLIGRKLLMERKQTDNYTGRQTDNIQAQTDNIQADKQTTYRQTNRQLYRQTNRQHTGRQTDNYTGRQTDNIQATNRQHTGRQTDNIKQTKDIIKQIQLQNDYLCILLSLGTDTDTVKSFLYGFGPKYRMLYPGLPECESD